MGPSPTTTCDPSGTPVDGSDQPETAESAARRRCAEAGYDPDFIGTKGHPNWQEFGGVDETVRTANATARTESTRAAMLDLMREPADRAAATRWAAPIPLALVAEYDPDGFMRNPAGTTGVPVGSFHPGAFGAIRRHHVHEGVDLYCPEGTTVHCVEDGVVVAVIPFTGPSASPPSPWWRETMAVLVEGASGVVVYGEIGIGTGIREGVRVGAGEIIGHVRRVLTRDKGRPTSMLHLELRAAGARDACEWTREGGRPADLLDPTSTLLAAID